MVITAQQLFRDLESNARKPFYVIVGEEPFQQSEIVARIKKHFLKEESDLEFNYESWDAEDKSVSELLRSLDTLPGLFATASLRLIVGRNFDKVTAAGWLELEPYLSNPSDSTCLVVLAHKMDKRKSHYKKLDEAGYIVEIAEPFDREWPKWTGYFERKVGKRIEPVVWESLVELSGKSLSLVWAELQKMASHAGDRNSITIDDLSALSSSSSAVDIFNFAEDVMMRRKWHAMKRYQELLRGGESEIKIISILARQFRLVRHYLDLNKKNITDPKTIGAQIGVNPYFISKIATQARVQTPAELERGIALLADCDYRLKTGAGGVFEYFLLPFLSKP